MKKQQYIAPATRMVRVETMKMVAVSDMSINTNADAVTDVDKLLSRRRSNLWDDEEEQ